MAQEAGRHGVSTVRSDPFKWVNLAERQVGDDVAVPRPPILASLHGYQRSWAGADVGAGLTLLAIAIPQQLATSRLADMPPVTGFYAFVAGTVLFALLGTNRQMSVGADSTIAPLFAAGVSAFALTGSVHYVNLVEILAVMVGLMVMLVSILRLGWIAEFLSTPIITGFLSGVALIIIAHQLPEFFGLPPTTGSDQHRVAYVLTHLGQVNAWSLAIGAGVLIIMIVSARVNRRIPAGLIGWSGPSYSSVPSTSRPTVSTSWARSDWRAPSRADRTVMVDAHAPGAPGRRGDARRHDPDRSHDAGLRRAGWRPG